MGEKLKQFGVYNILQIIIVLLVLIFIIYSDYTLLNNVNWGAILYVFIVSFLFSFNYWINKLGDVPMLVVYGLYIVTIYGYTFYQWHASSNNTVKDCSMIIPRTEVFSKYQYYIYRIMYLITIIVIVVLIQNLLDNGGELPKKFSETQWMPSYQKMVIILPFILPLLTEFVNLIVSLFSSTSDNEYSINPESLLANFMLGDSNSDPEKAGTWIRLAWVVVFYIILIGYAFHFGFSQESKTPIYFILIFMIGFSFWMRAIFVQDCSLNPDKDIYKDKESKEVNWNLACTFEKYGGLQAIIATCFLINMLSYIKNPTYKAFVFIIILLGSGLLANLFILNIESDGSNTEAKKN